MRKLKSLITLIGGVVAAIVFFAPTVSALPTQWTITPTGNVSLESSQFVIVDSNGNEITCGGVSAQGTTGPSPQTGTQALLAAFRVTDLSMCSGPFGSTWSVTPDPASWQFHATDYIPPPDGANGTGAVIGFIDGISIHLTGSTLVGTCDFDLAGSVDARYDNPSPGGTNGILRSAVGIHGLAATNKSGAGCSIVGERATLRFAFQVLVGSVSPVIAGS